MADDPDTKVPPETLPNPGSPTPEADAEAEEQLLQLLAIADTCYNSLDAMVRPVHLKYKISHIKLMSEFVTALDGFLARRNTSPACIANLQIQRHLRGSREPGGRGGGER